MLTAPAGMIGAAPVGGYVPGVPPVGVPPVGTPTQFYQGYGM